MHKAPRLAILVVAAVLFATLAAVLSIRAGQRTNPPQDSLAAALQCPASQLPADCMRTKVRNALTAGGADAAQDALAQMASAVAPDPFPCHSIAHFAGRESYAYLSGDMSKVSLTKKGPLGCQDGFLHGLLEGLGLSVPRPALVDTLNMVCTELDLAGEPLEWCRHGLGHAAAMAEKSSIRAAVSICTSLHDDLRSECVGGVVMTYGAKVIVFDWDQHDLEVGSGRPVFTYTDEERRSVCPSLPDSQQEGCWFNLWLMFEPGSAAEASKYSVACAEATSPTDRQSCGRGLGFLAVNVDDNEPVSVQVNRCRIDGSVSYECVYGVISSYVAMARSSTTAPALEGLCAGLQPEFVAACVRAESEATASLHIGT